VSGGGQRPGQRRGRLGAGAQRRQHDPGPIIGQRRQQPGPDQRGLAAAGRANYYQQPPLSLAPSTQPPGQRPHLCVAAEERPMPTGLERVQPGKRRPVIRPAGATAGV
jgi:hypothetical protein